MQALKCCVGDLIRTAYRAQYCLPLPRPPLLKPPLLRPLPSSAGWSKANKLALKSSSADLWAREALSSARSEIPVLLQRECARSAGGQQARQEQDNIIDMAHLAAGCPTHCACARAASSISSWRCSWRASASSDMLLSPPPTAPAPVSAHRHAQEKRCAVSPQLIARWHCRIHTSALSEMLLYRPPPAPAPVDRH